MSKTNRPEMTKSAKSNSAVPSRLVTKDDVSASWTSYRCAIGEGLSTDTIIRRHREWKTMVGALRDGLAIEL